MKRVAISGCCVSRDTFNYDRCRQYEVCSYRQLDPISLQFTPPMHIPGEVFEKLEFRSNYIRSCAEHVCRKDTAETLLNGDILVIDCADERIPKAIIDIGDHLRSGYARHEYFQSMTNYFKEKKVYQEIRFNGLPWEQAENAYQKWTDIITDTGRGGYDPGNIYIVEVFMAEQYIDRSHNIWTYDTSNSPFSREYIQAVNVYLRKVYDLLERLLPTANVIRLPKNLLTCSFHRWGLNPLHYMTEVYEYILDCIDIMSGSSNRSNPDTLYEELKLKNYMIRKLGNDAED